jgi:hypothetical protein
MSTGNIWRETNPEIDRTSPKQVIVNASEFEENLKVCELKGV